ncbi:EAL domain-containing protein [Streptomyces lunaelactis]|uniref:two-component system response regulator n=1 Tax=Streptomyces lunaelactis TaxID=1535768 RepID=UPI00158561C3|nr:EAL domain-containing protein [Streptomyces lunaelactis]NUK53858.1 EAL domain-containing protein [Streptomyces lunaelactis]NUK67515.1 EAL domain-containing protein [Streptomyces lunaelactis]
MSASQVPPERGSAQEQTAVRTLIADDVYEVRDGLARLLDRIPGIDVVGTAGDGVQAVQLTDELAPAVVLMDMRMPGMDGLAAIGEITAKHHDTAVIVLSAYDDESMVVEALLRGARSYLLKGADAVELVHAIEAAARGESRVSGSLTKPLLNKMVETLAEERKLRADAEASARDLAERHAEIRALSERLAGLLDAAPVGIIETDTADRVLRWNPAAERIYGRSAEEVLGRPDPNPAPPRAIRVTDGPVAPQSAEHTHSDGSTVHVEVARAGLTDPSGRMTGVIKVITDVTDRKELEAKLHHQAFHERLTGLPNRDLFIDRTNVALTAARSAGRKVTVFMLDLDDFKTINDSLGHASGDRLLVIAARRLEACLRPQDTLSRLGGDEFAVLIDQPQDAFTPEELADRMLTALRRSALLEDHPATIRASIGFAESIGEPDEDANSLLRDADTAMYAAKSHGKARFEKFEVGMRVAVLERAQLETDLRAALELGQFELHYQPIVQLDTLQLQGVEALLRWRHPQRGLLLPAMFVDQVEQLGLMPRLGNWVFETACAQLTAWHAEHPERADLTMSINVSASQLVDSHFVSFVEQCLAGHQLDTHSLVVEITEGMLVTQTAQARAALQAIHETGVRIAIDDFGTGYSSLSYLRELAVDIIKIDKSFVDFMIAEEDAATLTRTIIAMAEDLGLQAVAEGVADPAQLARLVEQQCPSGQGELFSCAARPEYISAMLGTAQSPL